MARPRSFDEAQVLDESMQVFWRQGYEGTSVDDLVRATGLSRSSLYQAFSNKRGVLEASMQHYRDTRVEGMVAILERPNVGIDNLIGFFMQFDSVAREFPERLAMGCMITNTVAEMAVVDSALRPTADGYFARLRGAFLSALNSAEELGEIDDGTAATRSRMLSTMAIGLFVMMRGNPDIEDVLSIVGSTTELIEDWRVS